MLQLSSIVVPVDFSDQCRGILPYARLIAETCNADLTLLHVVNPVFTIPATGMSGPATVPVSQTAIAARTEHMATFGADELRGLQVRRLVYEGDPVEQIVRFVEAEGVQLVVMPTHGFGFLRRFLIGSVTAKVLHDVACPVLTGVHMNEPRQHLPLAFSRIVCAVDLEGQSRDTLRWAAGFAGRFHAGLSIVHALGAAPSRVELQFARDWKTTAAKLAREEIGKLLADAGADAADVFVQEGETAKTVSSFAKSANADLLVIGRGSHEPAGGRLGKNAYAIIRESPCPVVSV